MPTAFHITYRKNNQMPGYGECDIRRYGSDIDFALKDAIATTEPGQEWEGWHVIKIEQED